MARKDAIEILARGVCVKEDKVLLCHTKGAENTYLPGGHVEFMERAVDALAREIEEELGMGAEIGRFLGAVEHCFVQKGKKHCEINLVFEMDVPDIAVGLDPASQEDYIEFLWAPTDRIRSSNLEPHVLRRLLLSWLSSDVGVPGWASTYGESREQ